jgi:hypothetical protein
MRSDQDFLLDPLASAERPACPGCGRSMEVVLHEARKTPLIFRLSAALRALVPNNLFANIETNQAGARRFNFTRQRRRKYGAPKKTS